MKPHLIALLTLPLTLALGACGGSTPDAAPKTPGAHCLPVPASTMNTIASENFTPIRGAAVESLDFKGPMYMIAIEFDAGGEKDAGVWAAPKRRDPGVVMSVDAMAAEFSDWPQGTLADPLDITVGGAEEALACLGY